MEKITKENQEMTLLVSELSNYSFQLKVHAEREMTNREKKS